jgi:uncharacterized protein (TIGR02996 family)
VNTGSDLYAAICAEPDSDVHRLVYADWLDDHDEPERAEFIRAQVERARLPADDTRQEALRQRDRELRVAHGESWRLALLRLPGVSWHRFWRGFVSGADVAGWKFFRRQADALFRSTPVQFLRILKIHGGQCPELAASPYLGRLLGLNLSGTAIAGEGLRVLAGCPALAGLQSLELCGWYAGSIGGPFPMVWEDGARALLESPYLNNLRTLDLRNNGLRPDLLAALRARFGEKVVLAG